MREVVRAEIKVSRPNYRARASRMTQNDREADMIKYKENA